MDALLVVVIVAAVLMALVGVGVVAGSGRQRRADERRIRAKELRREAEFHEARADQARAEAEERVARARREEAAARAEAALAEELNSEAAQRHREATEIDPDRPGPDEDVPQRGSRFNREKVEESDPEESEEEHLPGNPRDER